MNNCATEGSKSRSWIWLIWFIVIFGVLSSQSMVPPGHSPTDVPLLGVATLDEQSRKSLFPWQKQNRCKKWAYEKYKSCQEQYRRAKRASQVARLYLGGLLCMSEVVNLLTFRQVRYNLGALPVLYSLLKTLEVEEIINRHCPTRSKLENGTVVVVLVLNRLIYPLPLYKVSDWVSKTMLVKVLGVEAEKFNDDRLGRTLDALNEKVDAIWEEIVDVAIRKADIDLSVIFYDLSAFISHGKHEDSELIDFGFAHNTPSDKRKLKIGLNVSSDGNIPWHYRIWSGRMADQSTVQANLENLSKWLDKHGYSMESSLVVGDRAMLNAELAIAYDEKGVRHLTGLKASTKEQKELITCWSDEELERFPIIDGPDPQNWGKGCQITFTHEEKSTTQKGLVVLSGPMRNQIRQARETNIQLLEEQLEQLKQKIGKPRFRTPKVVQRSVHACLKKSPAGKFLDFKVLPDTQYGVSLQWQKNELELFKAQRGDGRYFIVTNDYSLSHHDMFKIYRDKDGVETCFHISKSDLKLSPFYLHKEKRIKSMIFVNMLALMAYNLFQRQIQQHGIDMTTRSLIDKLEHLVVIETLCHDRSHLVRLAHVEPQILELLTFVKQALDDIVSQNLELPQTQPSLNYHSLHKSISVLC